MEKTILRLRRFCTFSHSLGQSATWRRLIKSGLAPDIGRGRRHVRKVPLTDYLASYPGDTVSAWASTVG
jgi:hypothetical protein